MVKALSQSKLDERNNLKYIFVPALFKSLSRCFLAGFFVYICFPLRVRYKRVTAKTVENETVPVQEIHKVAGE